MWWAYSSLHGVLGVSSGGNCGECSSTDTGSPREGKAKIGTAVPGNPCHLITDASVAWTVREPKSIPEGKPTMEGNVLQQSYNFDKSYRRCVDISALSGSKLLRRIRQVYWEENIVVLTAQNYSSWNSPWKWAWKTFSRTGTSRHNPN